MSSQGASGPPFALVEKGGSGGKTTPVSCPKRRGFIVSHEQGLGGQGPGAEDSVFLCRLASFLGQPLPPAVESQPWGERLKVGGLPWKAQCGPSLGQAGVCVVSGGSEPRVPSPKKAPACMSPILLHGAGWWSDAALVLGGNHTDGAVHTALCWLCFQCVCCFCFPAWRCSHSYIVSVKARSKVLCLGFMHMWMSELI